METHFNVIWLCIQKGAQVIQKSPAVTKPQSKKVTKESSSEESSEEDEPVKPVSKPASKVNYISLKTEK